jgi:hypothetical protein
MSVTRDEVKLPSVDNNKTEEVRSNLLGKLLQMIILETSSVLEEIMIPLKALDVHSNRFLESRTGRLHTQVVGPPGELKDFGGHSLTAVYMRHMSAEMIFCYPKVDTFIVVATFQERALTAFLGMIEKLFSVIDINQLDETRRKLLHCLLVLVVLRLG